MEVGLFLNALKNKFRCYETNTQLLHAYCGSYYSG